jgi:hypothetical protein
MVHDQRDLPAVHRQGPAAGRPGHMGAAVREIDNASPREDPRVDFDVWTKGRRRPAGAGHRERCARPRHLPNML